MGTKAAYRGYATEEGERYAFVRGLLARVAPPPADLIEFGAAPGVQAVELAQAGYRVTAVDLGEAEWSDSPKGGMQHALAGEGVELVRWDLDRTPYPIADESFDVALLTEVLEHLREYPASSLSEMRRVLRRGGLFVLTTPNAAYLKNRLRLACGRSVYTPLSDWMYGLPHARHAREYTRSELETLVWHVGLEPVLVTSRHFYRVAGSRSKRARIAKAAIDAMARRAPSLGPSLVVVARRT